MSRDKEKASPPLFRRKSQIPASWGFWSKTSLGRKGGKEEKEREQIKVLLFVCFTLFIKQNQVKALRISSERCIFFNLMKI